MKKEVRELLFEPLSKGRLQITVPILEIAAKDGETWKVPAEMTWNGREFILRIFDNQLQDDAITQIFGLTEDPTEGLILNETTAVKVRGHLAGRVYFECEVQPTGGRHFRRPGICSIDLRTQKLHLTDSAIRAHQQELTRGKVSAAYSAHVIFHGPKLQIRDGSSKVTTTNEFLGDWYSETMNTHSFESDTWGAALIQKDAELHLHLSPKKDLEYEQLLDDPREILRDIMDSVGFTHGFKAWPVYYSFWSPKYGREEWLRPDFNLKQSDDRPVQGPAFYHPRMPASGPYENIIPVIAEGLKLLPAASKKRLKFLLWNVTEVSTVQLPDSTTMLILTSAIDGILQIAAQMEDGGNTRKFWKDGAKRLDLQWEGWVEGIFELRKKYRDDIAHGRLWHIQEIDSADYFRDYPKLASAFAILFARLCGYAGPMINENQDTIEIKDLMNDSHE